MVILDNAQLLVRGAAYTAVIFVGAATLAFIIATVVGVLLTRPSRPLNHALRIYVEVFRGTSAVVQLFWLFFVLPLFGLRIPAVTAAIIGLGLCFGAYAADAVRSGILSVPGGQHEAARALGLGTVKTYRLVVLPQVAVIVIPLFENLAILLLKATAGASLITVPELTFTGYALNVATFQTVQIFTAILIIYYLFATLVTALSQLVQHRLGRWQRAGRRA